MSVSYEELKTPCYIIDRDKLENVVNNIKDEILKKFPGAIIAYAVKANYHPYIIGCLIGMGIGMEVVSEDEYYLITDRFKEVNKIIYNGPVKSKESFYDAIKSGHIVNIDSFTEIEWLNELPAEKQINVGIRVNFDMSLYSTEYKESKDISRFGFSIENDSFDIAVKKIRQLKNIRINTLHMHRGGTSKSYGTYQTILEVACRVIREYNLEIEYIDIGGGLRLGVSNDLVIGKYLDIMKAVLVKNSLYQQVKLIFELGNSMVYPCVDYAMRVYGNKEIENMLYVTTDGTRIHTDPLFNRKKYMKIEIYKKGVAVKIEDKEQILCGCTCKERDVFVKGYMPQLLSEDIVVLKEIGAYSMSMCPEFIIGFPCVYILEYGILKLYKEKRVLCDVQAKS